MKKLKIILIVIFVSLVIFSLNYYLKKNNLLFYSSGSNEKAFLNTTWKMSPNEVKRANNINLAPAKVTFFNLPDQGIHEYPRIIRMERYKLLEQKEGVTLWGFETNVEYAFFDENLFEYTALLKGYNSDKMHNKIISALTEKYGSGETENNKTYIHSMQWETNSERARYWMLEKNNKARVKSFLAGVRVTYKPMFTKIEKIGQKEHQAIF